MNNQKIALLVPSLGGGGAERMMANLAKGLASAGENVDLVLFNAEGPYLKNVPEEINVVNLNIKRALFSINGIAKYLKEVKPAAMISTLSRVNISAIIAGKLSGGQTKIIIREANTFSILTEINASKWERIIYAAAKIFYRFADEIVAVSEGVGDDLLKNIKFERNKLHIIYNPVVDNQIEKLSLEKPEIDSFLNKDKKIIIAAGRFTQQKDFQTLIKAFNIVRKSMDCRLVILGSGKKEDGGNPEEYRKVLDLIEQFKLEKDVVLPGFVSNPYKYFKNSDVFVLSSRSEGLPGVLIQAMACGCPVVSTDCPSGPSEVLNNGEFGKLVKVGDFENLADAMIKTLNDPLDSYILIDRANQFNIEKAVNNYSKLI